MRWSAVFAMAVFTGCNLTDPDPPSFSFELKQLETMDYQQPKLTVRGGPKRIDIEGETWTGCGGATLKGELTRPNEQGLVLIVTEQQPGDACTGVVTPYEYDAIIGDLERGRYHLQILLLHARGLTPPRTIFHDFVTVS